MTLTDADRAYIARHVAEVRARQGLPPTITDPVILDRIAELIRSARADPGVEAENLTYSVAEAAALLGISEWTYYDHVKKGDLPALRIGRRIVVPRIAIERLLDPESGNV